MKRLINILLHCTILLAALSCVKDGPIVTSADKITFAPYIPQTKTGFIDDFQKAGYEIKVYDYMKQGNTTGRYMDGVSIVSDADGNWDYKDDDAEFLWLDKTDHSFFGWLNMANNTLFTPSFDTGTRILSTGTIRFTAASQIYDFLYSNVEERSYEKQPADGSNPDTSPVDLQMNHLFSAFRLQIENYRNQTVGVISLQLKNLYTTKSATIDFTNSASVTFADQTQETITGTVQNLGKNGKYNPFNTTADAYFMIWPQTVAEFDNASLSITYQFDGRSYTKEWRLEDIKSDVTEWLPGKRYNYTIKFTDKEVELICNVVEWEKDEQLLDFADHVSVRAEGEIDWDETTLKTYNYETGEIVVKSNGAAANCTFTIDTPEGAVWTASLITIAGPSDAFSFVGDNFGPVGTQANLSIKANYTGTGQYQTTHKAYLQITVQTLDNRTIVVKDLIPDGKSYQSTGYTIIQDMI